MLKRVDIEGRQLMILVTLYTIGDSILLLPSIVTSIAKQDAWIATLLGVTLGPFIIVFLYEALRKCYPDLTLIEYSEKIWGKWLGKFVSLLFLTFFFITSATYLREIGDFVTTAFMPKTPMEVIIILFLLVIIMAVRLGIETIVRSAEIFFPIVFILLTILILFLLPSVEINNLKPVFEEGIKPIIKASIPVIVFPFMEPVAILMILPYVRNKEVIKKQLFKGTFLAGAMILVSVLLTVLVTGADLSERHLYSTYELAKNIVIKDIMRIEAFLAFIWIITIFFRLSLFFYVTTFGLAQLLDLKNYRHVLFPIGMILIVFTITMAQNIVEYNQMIGNIWPFYAMTFGFFFPLIMLIVAKFKTRNL